MSIDLSPVQTDINYEKEGKQVTYLRIPHSRNSSAWGKVLIPIVVIQNSKGPTALLVGGSHGGEHEGPVSLLKLARELQPEHIHGRIIILPAMNLPAVEAGQRVSPIDGLDMNRSFPGKPDGSVTQIIAHYVHEAILPLCDAVLDIHAGGYSLDLYPYMSMHYLGDTQQMANTRAALYATQAPMGIIMEEFTGTGLLDYAVEAMGKVFLCAEIGGYGRLTKHTIALADVSIRNFLKHYKILEGEIVTCEDRDIHPMRMMEIPDAENYHHVMSAGIYEPCFDLGDEIKHGEVLGRVHFVQYPEQEPELVLAERAGVLIGTRGPGQVELGDCVALIARNMTKGT